jgi:hypothetical protein
MEYPEDFEKWAKHNPWMQENKAEAYKLWKRKGSFNSQKAQAARKADKKAKAVKKKNKPRKYNKRKSKGTYVKYIKSAEWKEKSRLWRAEAGKCELCGAEDRLQCHHKHYRTLGKEKRSDIQVVCYKCHCKIHGVDEFRKF